MSGERFAQLDSAFDSLSHLITVTMAASNPSAGKQPGDDSEHAMPSLQTTLRYLVDVVRHPDIQRPVVEDLTNEEVLGIPHDPSVVTLQDAHNKRPSSWWLAIDVEREKRARGFFVYARNSAFMKEMRHAPSFHEDLPPMNESFHDVWVLCRQRGTAVESVRHWSVMTQGHLWHLKADKTWKRNGPLQTGVAMDDLCNVGWLRRLLHDGDIRTPISYEAIDFSSVNTAHVADEQRRLKRKQRKKFVAYHVGQSKYSAAQVEKLARAVKEQMEKRHMGTYDVLENNCQHFVVSLLRRIVMTQRRCIAVGGTRLQLAQWDIGFPGYKLVKWLTPTKARLLNVPLSYTRKFPKRLIFIPTLFGLNVHITDTLPRIVERHIRQKTWRNVVKEIKISRQGWRDLKGQCRERLDKVAWAKFDIWGLIGWTVFWSLLSACVQEVYSKKASSVATQFLVECAPELISTGILGLMIALKVFYNRTSLTIVHYDLKRTRNGPFETEDPASSYSRPVVQDVVYAAAVVESEDESDAPDTDDERYYPLGKKNLEKLHSMLGTEEWSDIENDPPPAYHSDSDDPGLRPAVPRRRPQTLPPGNNGHEGTDSRNTTDQTLCSDSDDQSLRPALPARTSPTANDSGTATPQRLLEGAEAAAERPSLQTLLTSCEGVKIKTTAPPLPPRRKR